MNLPLFSTEVRTQADVVMVRQKIKLVGTALGFEPLDQTRTATAVSEIARNSWEYAQGGRVEVSLERGSPGALVIVIQDQGNGIPELSKILEGTYVSKTGMGIGIAGSRKLVDRFEITSTGKGTRAVLTKWLPIGTRFPSSQEIAALSGTLAREASSGLDHALEEQNQELVRTLTELRQRQQDLDELNRELADTNRGVVALYAELDQRAESLRKANDAKTRFLSLMSHEFRTPLNSVVSMSNMLLDELDGPLTPEQRRQVTYIRHAAQDLNSLVNDLLDLSKVEAGKAELIPTIFELAEFIKSLRALFRPLVPVGSKVELIFEEVPAGRIRSDETKLAQILRNLISNALKFTEQGSVTVRTTRNVNGGLDFEVIDTGIGIAPEDQQRIFEEYAQVDSAIQRQVKGTGLGLPLVQRLTQLLGAELILESAPFQGSRFIVSLPASIWVREGDAAPPASDFLKLEPKADITDFAPGPLDSDRPREASGRTALIIDDDPAARLFSRSLLETLGFVVKEATGGREGLTMVAKLEPQLVMLDLKMPDMQGFTVLQELISSRRLQSLPVVICSSQELEAEELRYFQQVTLGVLPKGVTDRQEALSRLKSLLQRGKTLA